MAEVTIFDQNKTAAGTLSLDPEVFEVPVRPEILHFVVRAQRASWRSGTHATLTRTLMKGGGAKPWRQKGTGRARAGSNNSPLWRGGAVIFGPQPRTYDFKVNKKVWRLALKMALSARLAGEQLIVVNTITLPEAKTKHFVKVKEALGLKKALVVAPEEMIEVMLAARNVPGVTIITPEQLNVYDILNHNHLVLVESVVEQVTARLTA
ncbi:50S ribosomal protein L4 [Desulfovibrio cuneatus]|uniref:50S ribosomal protein L4 n=1 Tax=Desulfovibrio cuneatus TaxID=159728 RepID=UPI0004882596|nr:50S ribosomal protein L4 [Desulfovibrio cuneatus]